MNPTEEQGFVGVDVTDACDEGLVEEGVFNGPLAALELLGDVGGGEGRIKGFRSEALESGDDVSGWAIWRDPPELAEGALVDVAQFLLVTEEKADAGVFSHGGRFG